MKIIRTFLFLILSLLSCSISFAQSERLRTLSPDELKQSLKPNQSVINGWLVTQIKGDELLGTTDDVQYFWTDGRCSVNLYPNRRLLVCSISDGIFDLDDNAVKGIVGYYDKDYNLVDKGSEWFHSTSSSYDYVYISYSHADFIFNYLQNKYGFVRFVIPTYGSTPSFDITVRCFSEYPSGK